MNRGLKADGGPFALARVLLAGGLAAVAGCGGPAAAEVRVFAAASTTEWVRALAVRFERDQGVAVRCSFAASSTLAQQIDRGATCDIFVAAHRRWMDYLAGRGHVVADSRADVLSNDLVVIAPRGRGFPLARLADIVISAPGRLAIGDSHVPAGIYAQQALEHAGCWGELAPRLVRCVDVRDVLQKVASASCRAGIVYGSDIAVGDGVEVVARIPADSHDPIVYPAALIVGAGDAAGRFLAFLRSPVAQALAGELGFAGRPRVAPAAAASGPLLPVVLLSLQVALWCAVLTLVPGIAVAWLLARCRFPGKSLVDALVHLPLVLPPVVTGWLLLVVFGPHGPLGRLLDGIGLPLAFDWKGAVLASAVIGFPLMVRAIRLSIQLVDPRLEDASRTLGARPLRVFLTITLPLALPGIVTGSILAFARSLGEFGATIAFISNLEGQQTLPLAIFSSLQVPGGDAQVLRFALVSLALALLAMIAGNLLAARAERALRG